MAITAAFSKATKQALLEFLATRTLKLALYTSAATLDKDTAAYTTSNEVSDVGTGYTAGGYVLANVAVAMSGDTAYLDFDDIVIPNASITARGALIYDADDLDRAVAVLDFGADITSTNDDFTVSPPAPGANAILRIA